MVAQQRRIQSSNQKKKRQGSKISLLLLLISMVVAIFIVAQFKGVDFLTIDKDGNVQLSEERKKKLANLEEIDKAVQYGLYALSKNLYPCYNCYGEPYILLLEGEVWKFGITTLGEKRYSQEWLNRNNLVYVVEQEGTIGDCLKMERTKIVTYALLPENIKREKPLIRPPGNKQDN